MRRTMRHLSIALGFLLLWPRGAGAHGSIDVRIAEATRAVAAAPRDAQRYVKRGELHRLHEDWPAARADFDRAARLAPDLLEIRYARGRACFEAGAPEQGLADLDAFLAVHPDHADALLTRSRALAALGRRVEAIDDLSRAIGALRPAAPEHYLERAALLAGEGRIEDAVAGLDEGIARLGPLVTLIQTAYQLELAAGRPDRALARLDALPRNLRLSPAWLLRRGDLCRQVGRADDAYAAYVLAEGSRWVRAKLRARGGR